LSNSSKKTAKLNPEFRERLLKESQNPLRGLRRILWLLFFVSSSLGILIMGTKFLGGQNVPLTDGMIQITALIIFGTLVWLDRDKSIKPN
tara:strand:+ start:84 stop:353 length:270 start_codon:yes stop_codon:yes gene_type:complete